MMACLIVLYTEKKLGLVKKQGNEKKISIHEMLLGQTTTTTTICTMHYSVVKRAGGDTQNIT